MQRCANIQTIVHRSARGQWRTSGHRSAMITYQRLAITKQLSNTRRGYSAIVRACTVGVLFKVHTVVSSGLVRYGTRSSAMIASRTQQMAKWTKEREHIAIYAASSITANRSVNWRDDNEDNRSCADCTGPSIGEVQRPLAVHLHDSFSEW